MTYYTYYQEKSKVYKTCKVYDYDNSEDINILTNGGVIEAITPWIYKTSSRTKRIKSTKIGRYNSCSAIPIAFDIETTSIYDENNKANSNGYCYIWQLMFGECIITGRYIEDVQLCLDLLLDMLYLKLDITKGLILIIWDHNLSFEFQFLKRVLNFDEERTFMTDRRECLKMKYRNYEFRDSMRMTNSSLAKLAKDYCDTQKLVGDIDYEIPRSPKTKLTEKELAYCYNDVITLAEYHTFIYNNFISVEKKIPMTATAMVRHFVKKNYLIDKDNYKWLKSCWLTYEEYLVTSNWLFRGGYTHANNTAINLRYNEKDSIYSFDFTSSYPAVMIYGYVPGKFYKVKLKEGNIDKLMNTNKCYYFTIRFKNIEATSAFTIESKSKCIELSEDAIIDNGRVFKASNMMIMLTELDYKIYKRFYKWDSYEVLDLYMSNKIKLPKYVIDTVVKYAVNKNVLKREGKNYTFEKALLNAIYGMCVKKVDLVEYKIVNGEMIETNIDGNVKWDKITDGILLPQWGYWITARARYNLLTTIKDLEDIGYKCLYTDTDSIKILNYNENSKAADILNNYNSNVSKMLYKAKELYNISDEDFKEINDFGMWDCEGKIDEFMTLGAKRYLYRQGDKYNQTIAGLPKGKLIEYSKLINKDPFEVFANEMEIPIEVASKLCSLYNDGFTETEIDGVLCSSHSGVCLRRIGFKLKMDPNFFNLLENQFFIQEYERIILNHGKLLY